jgi:hypothetical protein
MKNNEVINKDLVHTLKFMRETSNGKYSKIERSSLQYIRLGILSEVEPDEIYYYSIS